MAYRRLSDALCLPFVRTAPRGKGVSSGQAASTALAATVGTGNIIGTAQALTMGGPGALFWLWVAALLGMTVKYAEILLGQRYRGGAMAYIQAALGRRSAGYYALLSAASALTVGNMAQMNGAVSALCDAAENESLLLRLLFGLILTGVLARFLLRGEEGPAKACAALVPPMALGYLLLTGGVLISYAERIPGVLTGILAEAFRPKAVYGAAGGAALRQTLLWGLRRGAFSNEAGLGTAANIHASSRDGAEAEHALWGIFEVFADTMILCTITGLTILCSGAQLPIGTLPGPELLREALSLRLGEGVAGGFLAGSLLLFGFSTVLGCAVSGQRCADWLLGKKMGRAYRPAYLLCAIVGSVLPVGLLWQMADTVNVLLAVPNLLALWILAPELGARCRENSATLP